MLQNRRWKTFFLGGVLSFQNTWLNVLFSWLSPWPMILLFCFDFLYKIIYFTLKNLIWAFSLNFKNYPQLSYKKWYICGVNHFERKKYVNQYENKSAAQTLPNEAPPVGKIHPFSSNFWDNTAILMPFRIWKNVNTVCFMTGSTIFNHLGLTAL